MLSQLQKRISCTILIDRKKRYGLLKEWNFLMIKQTKFPLGQLLIEKKIITQEQLDKALKEQKKTGDLLGVTLLKLGFVDEEIIFLPIVAGQMGVDYICSKDVDISKEALDKIPAKLASYYKILPIELKGDVLSIATNQPLNVHILDELSLVADLRLKPYLASEKDIMEGVRKYYGVGAETIEQMMGSLEIDSEETVAVMAEIDESDSDASISKFLNQILLQAYKDRATDVHVEPYEDELKIRYRVDGVLVDAKVPENIRHFKDAIISRIKILSNLNIAEKRKPQDGRFKLRIDQIDIDIRVSFLPTPYGESVVLRILNSTELFTLEQLGLSMDEQKTLETLIRKPNGIIFLTGPTGSGKTTTLYSCLSGINEEDKKIITIEDPIEYLLKGVTQIQINPSIGLSFAQGLRSMLRHDPDIMMVGEVRDIETAEISIQIALTGHLIFSTLHTNDAAGGVTRLLDMGVDPYLITSTVQCFIAQRLIRLLCPKCKYSITFTDEMFKHFQGIKNISKDITGYEAKGCEYCKFTGYRGRTTIIEMLILNNQVCELILKQADAHLIKEKARELGMRTLLESGWEKVKAGITNSNEVIRVINEAQE